jgi:tRNA(Ile)-lysidine synthase
MRDDVSALIDLELIKDYDGFVIGFSGGADSTALFMSMVDLANEGAIPKDRIVAVHVNHNIRGEEALRDRDFTKKTAEKYGIAYREYSGDVTAFAGEWKVSVEEAGRMYRRQCFKDAATTLDAKNAAVILAHHADDQVETFFFRIARGTGSYGLAGIKPVTIQEGLTYIRPFLHVRKAELLSYLDVKGEEYVTDSTNLDNDYSRNYVRNVIIPELEKLNPGVVEHVISLSEQILSEQEYFDKCAREYIEGHVNTHEYGQEYLDCADFDKTDDVIKFYIIREYLSSLGVSLKDINRTHYENMADFSSESDALTLPNNVKVLKRYKRLYVETDDRKTVRFSVTFDEVSKEIADKIGKKTYTKIVDCDKIESALVVRKHKEGDYIIIDRKGTRKKLSRFFIDEKIPVNMRDDILLVADGSEIVWVVGYRLNVRYYVTDDTTRFIRLYAEEQG